MSTTLAEIEQQARALSPEDRVRLVETLLESLTGAAPPEVTAAWEREIAERVAAYERGEAETVAAQDVFAEARRLAR